MRKKDLTGQRFGRLTVLREAPDPYISPAGQKTRRWVCRCDCGTELTVLQNALTRKDGTRSCGCSRLGSLQVDMTGQRFGRLTVLREAPLPQPRANGQRTGWLCRCDCGRQTIHTRKDLLSGQVLSCGCLLSETAQRKIKDNVLQDFDGTRISAIRPERGANATSQSGHKGVYWSSRDSCWIAKIGLRRKSITLGRYASLDCAIKARAEAEDVYYTPIIEAYKARKDHIMKKHACKSYPLDDHAFYTIWGAALESSDRDAYVSDWSLSSLLLDPEDSVPAGLPEQLGRIWDAAHATVVEIRAATGLSQAAFARRFCVPKRTIENWESRGGCPPYVRLLLCQAVGLLSR